MPEPGILSAVANPMSVEAEFKVPPRGEYWPHTWAVAGDVIISFTQHGSTPAQRFDQFIADASRPEITSHFGGQVGISNINTVQRKQTVDAFNGKQSVVVIENAVARGIVTAVSWLGMNIKAFSWNDIDLAVARVKSSKLTPAEIREIMAKLVDLSAEEPLFEKLAGPRQ